MQKNRHIFIILTLMISMVFPIQSYAKRLAPEPVSPIVINHTIYSSAFISGNAYVEAHDKKSKKLLWRQQIYKINYDANLESDIQDIHVTKMKVKNGNLIIHNEKGETYLLNIKTHHVKLISRKSK